MKPPLSTAAATTQMPFKDGFTRSNGMPAVPIVLGVAGHRDVKDKHTSGI